MSDTSINQTNLHNQQQALPIDCSSKDNRNNDNQKGHWQPQSHSKRTTASRVESELRDRTDSLLAKQRTEILRLRQDLHDYKLKLKQLTEGSSQAKPQETTISKPQDIQTSKPQDIQTSKPQDAQISELFQSNKKNKLEIDRLNSAVKTLVSSNQKYRRQLSAANHRAFQLQAAQHQLHQQYQILKFDYDLVSEDFNAYKRQRDDNLNKAHKELLFHRTYQDSLKANTEDLLKRVSSIPTYEHKIFQLQNAVAFEKAHTQRLKDDITRYADKISNLERNHSSLYEAHRQLQQEHQSLKKVYNQAHSKLAQLQLTNIEDTISHKTKQQVAVGTVGTVGTVGSTGTVGIVGTMGTMWTVGADEARKITQLIQQLRSHGQRNEKTLNTCKALANRNSQLKQQKRTRDAQLTNLKAVLSDYQHKLNEALNKNSILLHQSQKNHSQLHQATAQKDQQISALVAENQRLDKQLKGCSQLIGKKVAESEQLKRRLIQVETDLRQQLESSLQQQRKKYNHLMALLYEKIYQPQNNASPDPQPPSERVSLDSKPILARQDSAAAQLESTANQIEGLKDQIKAKSEEAKAKSDELKAKSEEIEKMTEERNLIAELLSNKTAENEKLKQKLLSLDEQFKAQLVAAIQKKESAHSHRLRQLQSQLAQNQPNRSQHQSAHTAQRAHASQAERAQSASLVQKVQKVQKLASEQEVGLKQVRGERDKLFQENRQLRSLLTEQERKLRECLREIARLHEVLETNQVKYRTKIEIYFRNNLTLEDTLCKTQKTLANKEMLYEDTLKRTQHLQRTCQQHRLLYSKLQTEFISVQLLTAELRQERDQLIKKNVALIKGIHHLNREIHIIHEGAQKVSSFFAQDSTLHQALEKHYSTVHQIFNSLQALKPTMEAPTPGQQGEERGLLRQEEQTEEGEQGLKVQTDSNI